MSEVLECTLDYLITGRSGDAELSQILRNVSEDKRIVAEKILMAILTNL